MRDGVVLFAELQVRTNGEIVLRELYPLKSDLYERAQQIKSQVSSVKFQISSLKSEG